MSAATPFARLQGRVNRSVMRHLADALATYAAPGGTPGEPVPVIFDPARAVVDQTTGVVVYRPSLDVLASAWPGADEGGTVAIVGGGSYRVRAVEPLGDDGMVTLTLARV